MAVRYKGLGAIPRDNKTMQEFAELAYPGRGSISVNARLRRLIEIGEELQMTSGDTVRVAIVTLKALDDHGALQPAIDDVLEAFNSGKMVTDFREPMNLYLGGSAVAALAVAVCEACRPAIALQESSAVPDDLSDDDLGDDGLADDDLADDDLADDDPGDGDLGDGETIADQPSVGTEEVAEAEFDTRSPLMRSAGLWPERNTEGFPQMTLDVDVWWPGLPNWERATITASVTPSLAFSEENFSLLIEQDGDPEPARVQAVWLLKREDLKEDIPVYELRGSTWEGGHDVHQFRFLVATSSLWCQELHDFLTTRWVSKAQSPTGPDQFDSKPFGGGRPHLQFVPAS